MNIVDIFNDLNRCTINCLSSLVILGKILVNITFICVIYKLITIKYSS